MKFKILSIDGGGIRGVFPAHVLKCISERLKISIVDNINLITGTSTGSIIAAAIACRIDPQKIISLYRDKGKMIFTPRTSFLPRLLRSGFHSVYKNDTLYKELTEVFQDIKLGDITTPLIIPATDIGNGLVHVFKSSYSPEFTRDKEKFVRDAVMASCSAPTYFDPTKVNEYLLADGGIWANNPSLVAFIDVQKRLGIAKSDIQILSIGTGQTNKAYGSKVNRKWGLLLGWQHRELVNFFMSLQAQATHNYLQLSLEPEQLLRVNFETDIKLPLDDYTLIDNFISRADQEFTYKSILIKKFFEIN